jgi:hypothetical protein
VPKANAYQKAIVDKEPISAEISRLFQKGLFKRDRDLSDLQMNFDTQRLLNAKNGKPISVRYKRDVLNYAYELYGKELIAELKGEKAVINKENVGGIDFNPDQLIIDSKGQKIEFNLNEELQKLETGPFNGFVPIIIDIKPVPNLPLMLGINLPADLPQNAKTTASSADHISLLSKEPDSIAELVGTK